MSTKALTFAARELSIERRTDGTLVLSSPLELGKCDWRITDFLPSWAHSVPDRIFLAQRNANGKWDEITYGEAWSQVQAVGQSLIEMGASRRQAGDTFRKLDRERGDLVCRDVDRGNPGADIAKLHADARRPGSAQGYSGSAAPEVCFRSERARLFRRTLYSRTGRIDLDQCRWGAGHRAFRRTGIPNG